MIITLIIILIITKRMDKPLQDITQLIAQAAAERTARADKQLAFAEIVQRFQDLAFGCAYAVLGDFYLAEDAAQEAFLSAWRNLDQFGDHLSRQEHRPGVGSVD